MGAARDRVQTECGRLRTGGASKTLEVAAASVGFLSPNLFGWISDGAAVNGVRLMGRAMLGVAVAEVVQKRGLPPVLRAWSAAFTHISVSHTQYSSPNAQIVNMWKETAINHKLNEKLNPIAMTMSLARSSG